MIHPEISSPTPANGGGFFWGQLTAPYQYHSPINNEGEILAMRPQKSSRNPKPESTLSWQKRTNTFKLHPDNLFLAAAIAALLRLPAPLAVGLILVGCCPGGTASNVVAMIARADVALSVVMTSLSTLAAVVLTPRLTELLASQYVPVDGWLLLLRVLQVVLLPVAFGVVLKRGMPSLASRVEPVMPPIAVVAVVMIVASVVGSQRQLLLDQGLLLLLACLLLHAGGFALGYLLARLSGEPIAAQRTISLEVGMQNSGLAVVLARSGGFASPLTALPGAVSAVVHCMIGSGLAGLWRAKRLKAKTEK